MTGVIQWLKSHLWWVGGGMVIVILLLVGGYLGLREVQAAPPQPIQFKHSRHEQVGIQCQYCHPGGSRGAAAGLPALSKCLGCHRHITARTAEMEKITDFAESGRPREWVPVAIQPDFVRFSHQPHIKFGFDCQECHGDVGSMVVAEPQRNQNMGWCLSCHQEKAPERFEVLSDCATCHY